MADKKQAETAKPRGAIDLRAATQALPFPPGLYVFSVRAATPKAVPEAGNLPFPALLVASGPGVPAGTVEFSGLGNASSAWIYNAGDQLAVKVGASGATLILSSLRTAGTDQPFDIKVDAVDPTAVAAAAQASAAKGPALKLQIGLHLRTQGDVQFVDSDWAGRAGSGAWIEAMSIVPLETLKPTDIEYKGLSANGFESPWLSDGASCGTKGISMPLIGFAVRLKPQAAAEYDCEYSAAFRSGVVVGPLRNGVPCRSKTAGDPLDAVQIRIVKRLQAAAAPATVAPAKQPASKPAVAPAKKGPSFSKFREDDEPVAKPASKKLVAVPAKAPSKKPEVPVKVPVKSAPNKAPATPAGKSTQAPAKPLPKKK